MVCKAVRIIDGKRLAAVTEAAVSEHIARVKFTLQRYNIKDPRCDFNIDQLGGSFSKMTGRSLRKGVDPKDVNLKHSVVRSKGVLDRVTVPPTVSAAGTSCEPVIVSLVKKLIFVA